MGKMLTVIGATFALSFLAVVGNVVRADEEAVKSIELRLEGQCDENNSRLWLINNHATKSVIAQLRWSLFMSKRVINDQFQIGPVSKREIGCAARADIVSAQFAP